MVSQLLVGRLMLGKPTKRRFQHSTFCEMLYVAKTWKSFFTFTIVKQLCFFPTKNKLFWQFRPVENVLTVSVEIDTNCLLSFTFGDLMSVPYGTLQTLTAAEQQTATRSSHSRQQQQQQRREQQQQQPSSCC